MVISNRGSNLEVVQADLESLDLGAGSLCLLSTLSKASILVPKLNNSVMDPDPYVLGPP
jgi:hypothetical protein